MVSRTAMRSREGFPLTWDELKISAGDYPEIGQKFKFGFGTAIPSGSEATVWGQNTLYAHPASAEAMTISSSSAADTSAGTGAQTVKVEGLDTNHAELVVTVSLNGQTGVALGTFIRVNRTEVLTAGSGNENAGTLYVGSGTVTTGVPASIYATVEPTRNQTLMCLWTVPAGKTAFLRSISASSGGNANTIVTVRHVQRPDGGVFQTKDIALITRASPLVYEHVLPIPIQEKTDIELRAQASTGTIDVSGTMEFAVVG